MGTLSLLQAAKGYWNGNFTNKLFYHVSTDEVYGSLGEEGFFTEETAYDPHSLFCIQSIFRSFCKSFC